MQADQDYSKAPEDASCRSSALLAEEERAAIEYQSSGSRQEAQDARTNACSEQDALRIQATILSPTVQGERKRVA